MNTKPASIQLMKALQDFSNDFDCQYAVTLKFTNDCQNLKAASAASAKFIRAMNIAVWGKQYYQKRKAALSYFPVLQDGFGTKELHLHCALGNIKPGINYPQMLLIFHDAVNAIPALKHKEKYLKPVDNPENYKEYICREYNNYNPDYALFEQFTVGIKPVLR
jgi:hypothetical protein